MSQAQVGTDGVDPEVVASFRERGWALTHSLDAEGLARLRSWVDEVASWPDDGGDWMHHRELTDSGPALCRSENLIPHHAGLRRLLTEGVMPAVAGALLGEPAVLYKEKVNYKLAGGAGYAPHQDAPAYPFIDQHVSCMVAVDDATLENGCLYFGEGTNQGPVYGHIAPPDEPFNLQLPLTILEKQPMAPAPVRKGGVSFHHGNTFHQSGPNHSSRWRRACALHYVRNGVEFATPALPYDHSLKMRVT